MNVNNALKWAKKELEIADVEGSGTSAEYLLWQVLEVSKPFILTHPEHELTAKQQSTFENWVARRAKHEPVWYITGEIEFCGLELFVNENVLIPRPETELLVEKILDSRLRGNDGDGRILDVGTGSGAIILALASNLRHPGSERRTQDLDSSCGQNDVKLYASDISEKALEVAKKNAENLFPRHSREGGNLVIDFRQGNLFEPWQGQKFDLIVTNLPYVPDSDKSSLAPDVRDFEPHLALFSGGNGLDIYNKFFDEVREHLKPGGKVFCEIGYDQGEIIQKYLTKILPNANVTVLGDYAGVDRIVVVET